MVTWLLLLKSLNCAFILHYTINFEKNKNEATNKKYTSNERIFYILYAKILKNLMIKDSEA